MSAGVDRLSGEAPAAAGEPRQRLWYALLLTAAFAVHLFVVVQRWREPLLDHHEFRQTQTAIAVASMLNGGSWIACEVPVLGRPWAIPFEFPLFQWLVAVAAMAGVPLDQAGRLISVLAFYLMLPAVHWLAGRVVSGAERLIPVMLLLVSPLYLFWTRTFMIESTALSLSVAWLALVVALMRRRSSVLTLLALLCGTAASLVKVTTFLLIGIPAAVVVVIAVARALREGRKREAALFAAGPALSAFVALTATSLWNRWADGVKRLNPMADGFLTTDSLGPWLFGTWDQKTSWDVWQRMLSRSVPEILGAPLVFAAISPLLLTGVIAFASRRFRLHAVVCLSAFLAGPAVFTNLYYVHNYYFYANGIYLLAIGAMGMFAAIHSGERAARMTRLFLLPLVLVSLIWTYVHSGYSGGPHRASRELLRFTAVIREQTAPEDILVIYGWDWNPLIPYYAGRRAWMDRWEMALDDPKFIRSMATMEHDRVGAMLVRGRLRDDPLFVSQRARRFGLETRPVLRHWLGDLYLRTPHKAAE